MTQIEQLASEQMRQEREIKTLKAGHELLTRQLLELSLSNKALLEELPARIAEANMHSFEKLLSDADSKLPGMVFDRWQEIKQRQKVEERGMFLTRLIDEKLRQIYTWGLLILLGANSGEILKQIKAAIGLGK